MGFVKDKPLNIGLFIIFLLFDIRYLYKNATVDLTVNGVNCNAAFEILFWAFFIIGVILLIIGYRKASKRRKLAKQNMQGDRK
jgi:uncharacterized membrane protein